MQKQRWIVFLGGLFIALALVSTLGYRFWYQPNFDFYYTDDAIVTGSLVRVAAPATGQITDLNIDVGDTVKSATVLATIKIVYAGSGQANSAPAVPRLLARVTAPIAGTVATRSVSVGDTVAAGQPIATIVDLDQLWVVVNIDETRAIEIRPNQPADVFVSAANQTFRGRIVEIGSATTEATAAPSVIGLGSSDTTKKVPVRIKFDRMGARLVPGMSAAVTIYTRGAPGL
jgi:multidrug resistance efflux pump